MEMITAFQNKNDAFPQKYWLAQVENSSSAPIQSTVPNSVSLTLDIVQISVI